MPRGNFVELAKVKISDKKEIVVSKAQDETIKIGQRMSFEDDNRKINFFLKGALEIPENKLYDLRDAINLAIKEIEK